MIEIKKLNYFIFTMYALHCIVYLQCVYLYIFIIVKIYIFMLMRCDAYRIYKLMEIIIVNRVPRCSNKFI